MKEKYLGDSYDLVKRFLCQTLSPIAPLYAHQDFVPEEIQARYTSVTTIPMLGEKNEAPYAILLDPDTGIRSPDQPARDATEAHVSLNFLIKLIRQRHPVYMICFDQSAHRKHALSKQGQREAKMRFLSKQGLHCCYYASHAPFLFITEKSGVLDCILDNLTRAGIPAPLLERANPSYYY